MSNFLDEYVSFVSEFTETRNIVHVWSLLASISAILGRNRYISFGDKRIYSNQYTMIVGEPGSRKSTGIKLARSLIEETGYSEFAFESGSKESYFNSLARRAKDLSESIELDVRVQTYHNGKELWEPPMDEAHSFICADEFDNFIGVHNMGFISALGDLWDKDSNVRHETIKHGVVVIPKPYITILGGTTPSTFSSMFPVQALDHGFLSRMLMIPCRGLARKLSLPPPPDQEKKSKIISKLDNLLHLSPKELQITPGAFKIYDEIYHAWSSPFDARFAGYSSRRHMHLLKIGIICAAIKNSEYLDEDSLIQANTLLTHTELLMPDVIGEMGKGPHTVAMNLVMNTLSSKPNGLSLIELYKLLYREVRSMEELHGVINLLRVANRIITDEKGINHFVPLEIVIPKSIEKFLDQSYATCLAD